MTERVTLHRGDCLEVMPQLAAAGLAFDACITDPPYHLTSIVKRFGAENSAPAKFGKDGAFARAAAGFMGQQWDGGDIAFRAETWRCVYDLLKPGAHLLAFGGTRTYHRLACAIEDAGFEIRGCITWLYGSGFPKSHDAGDGRGTALKPAQELICLARKPLIGTVTENIAAHGTGALNIEACRVAEIVETWPTSRSYEPDSRTQSTGRGKTQIAGAPPPGRWPADVIHDGSAEILAALPEETARFFYCAKASELDRVGTSHPTVKPLRLIAYLARLVTPPGGLILDPFAGSGTTGIAGRAEGFRAHLIEREAKYAAEIAQRLDYFAGRGAKSLMQLRAERPAARQEVEAPLLEALAV